MSLRVGISGIVAAALGLVCGLGCGQTKPPTKPAAPPVKDSIKAASEVSEQPEPPKAKPAPPSPEWERWDPKQSRSIGSVLEGRLEGGVQLPAKAPGMLHNPGKDRERAYGTVEVVRAIIRASQVLASRPESEHITINDLSFKEGGSINGHASHRAGRDMDFYFPLRTRDQKPFPGKLIPLDAKGIGHDYRNLEDPSDDIEVHIDLERTWDFLSALLDDPDAHIQVIYIVAHVQAALAKHARARGVSKAKIAHFLGHSCQPRGAPHDDHGHIRFYCSAQDIAAGCEDNAPIDPKQMARLRKAGVKPKIATPRPRSARKVKTTSAKQARKKAGKLHPSVEAFLDARKNWTRQIPEGPGRCR